MHAGEWTESARRALESLGHPDRSVSPAGLFWALVDQESRASEILATGGLTPVALAEQIPRTPGNDTADASIDHVLQEAQRLAGLAGRVGEVGTEHLLWGLAISEPGIGDVLARFGLKPDLLAPAIEAASGIETTPLVSDETLTPPETLGGSDPATDAFRMMDASANRAREGLRVVEDIARFTLDDAHLTGLLKQLRHDLGSALVPLDGGRFLAARDTHSDVGTALSTDQEQRRQTLRDVLDANLGRVQESLRTLEELSKLVSPPGASSSPGVSTLLERARYDLYTIHKALAGTLEARRRLDGKSLYLLAGPSTCSGGIGPTIRDAVAGGVSVVQLRDKQLADAELLDLARRVRRWTRESGALFIMNDRPDLAVLADADGVHVGQDELDVRSVRRIVGPDRLVGVSTHSIVQARQAVTDGADYLGVGPVFPSQTKTFAEFAGLEFVSEVAAEITLPWYAIGGISIDNLSEVLEAGATRVAVSAALAAADDARRAAEAFAFTLRG